MKELYNVEFCGQRPGVPIGVNVRVIAISNADARRQAKALLKPFWEGFELFKHYRGYADDGESCRIYIDCDLMAKRCAVDVEDDGIDWNAEQDDTGGVFVEDNTAE